MKKFIGSIKNRKGSTTADQNRTNDEGHKIFGGPMVPPQGDNPEAVVAREVIAFCESGAPGQATAGDEYLHLPAIVDSAESSPSAAKEASLWVKRYLGADHYSRGFAQYNAIMLTRILTDNPGRNFTQNFDKDFVATVKRLLRDTRDASVQQIMRETLDYFEAEKIQTNDSLVPLLEMWGKEKGRSARIQQSSNLSRLAPPAAVSANRSSTLPPPAELAARIEEAKTTARLLLQTLQSTPAEELSSNDLVHEFGTRVKAAQNSIQRYMSCENPRPDDDTMLTLIETNEQLNIAMSKHQRALLAARKATPSPQPRPESNNYMSAGQNVYSPPPQLPNLGVPVSNGPGYGQSNFKKNEQFVSPPPGPPPGARGAVRSPERNYASVPTNVPTQTHAAPYDVPDNPFSDDAGYEQPQNSYSLFGKNNNPNLSQQPYSGTQQPQSYAPSTESQQPRPGNYVPTPSYMRRQESAANNITMHGASPPPETSR